MVKRFPHTISFAVAAAATTALNGDLVPGVITTGAFSCRAEPSNGNGYTRGAGGTKIDFAWVVYCMRGAGSGLAVGTLVTIKNEKGQVIGEDTIKRVSSGQLNARIWL